MSWVTSALDRAIVGISLVGLGYITALHICEMREATKMTACPDNGRLMTTWLDSRSGNVTRCTYMPPERRMNERTRRPG